MKVAWETPRNVAMRRASVAAPLLLLVLCAQAPYVQPALTINVTISITVSGGGAPVIAGTTNLPEGFLAMVSMKDRGVIIGQDEIVIKHGHFTTAPFSWSANSPYPRGTYGVEIDSPFTDLQPPEVRSVIGSAGERLRGPYVVRSTFANDYLVHYQTRIEVR